jgi:glycosyltransferase involved in cell wall biosynthesis
MDRDKRIAVLAPVAWRTPPRGYGAWETVASNIAEGLAARGWDVTLFATADSVTRGKLHAVIERGYEEDRGQDPKVAEILHISEAMEHAGEFDMVHNNYDFIPLAFSRLIPTPMLTTIHGFSSDAIRAVYRKYRHDGYFVSISDSDRDPELPYLATVYNGIDLSNLTFRPQAGDKLVFLGRIHPDKGVHLAVEAAKKAGMELIIAGIIQDQGYFDAQVRPHVDDRAVHYIGPVGPVERDALFKDAWAVLHLNELPERFGLVMAEAMAAGVPVIAMDRGSCREVVADGRTGFLVANTDEAAAVVAEIPRIDRAECRRHVETHFTIDRMVSRYEEVYARIFADRVPKRRQPSAWSHA